MLLRRLVFRVLVAAVRNPLVQKKASAVANKALKAARPGLLKASRKADKMTRKVKQNINDLTHGR